MEEEQRSALDELREVQAEHEERNARVTVAAARSGGSYKLDLYEPIMVGNEKRTSLHFSRPQTKRDAAKPDDEHTADLCGLTVEQLMQLSSIDFDLTQAVLSGFHLRQAAVDLGAVKAPTATRELALLTQAFRERKARVCLAAAKSGGQGYTLELFDPITVGGEKRAALIFRAQTIRDIRASKSNDALTADLCGLTVEQLGTLSSIDATMAEEVIAGFHLRPAAGGLARKV